MPLVSKVILGSGVPFSFVSRSSFYVHRTVPLEVSLPSFCKLKPDKYFRRYQLERLAENEPGRKDFMNEVQTKETTVQVKTTEKEAQKESAQSSINNLAPRCRDFSAHVKHS